MTIQLTTRNATLADLAKLLQEQHARKHDVVAPARALHAFEGNLTVAGDGTLYRPTAVADEGIAEKLDIPTKYLRRLRSDNPELYDANINGWLSRDDRSFLVRTFSADEGSEGVARAFLSDRYRVIDNFDYLTAALAGLRDAGVNVEIGRCDLTERRVYVEVTAPEVQALAPALLERYRSPFTGASGADNPVVWAGFVLSNSETGGGAATITPRIKVQVCSNGLTIAKDAVRNVHLGGQLDEGVIRWSEDTQRRNLELVTAQARDAVTTFLDVEYIQRVIGEITEKAQTPIDKPVEAIEVVSRQLRFPKERSEAILDHFIKGADLTAGGVLHAVTSVAQTLHDADDAYELEAQAFRALEAVAA